MKGIIMLIYDAKTNTYASVYDKYTSIFDNRNCACCLSYDDESGDAIVTDWQIVSDEVMDKLKHGDYMSYRLLAFALRGVLHRLDVHIAECFYRCGELSDAMQSVYPNRNLYVRNVGLALCNMYYNGDITNFNEISKRLISLIILLERHNSGFIDKSLIVNACHFISSMSLQWINFYKGNRDE
jgi:hypothetical protein